MGTTPSGFVNGALCGATVCWLCAPRPVYVVKPIAASVYPPLILFMDRAEEETES